jgi:predicted nucleotidyltransferase
MFRERTEDLNKPGAVDEMEDSPHLCVEFQGSPGPGLEFIPKMGIIEPNMGTTKTATAPPKQASAARLTSLADSLFSTTQQRVLGLLFGRPGRSFYANEVMALTGGGSGAVQRELARLAHSGLVTQQEIGRQKHYQANPAAPIFAELCGIVSKTMGLAEPLRQALVPLAPRIDAAFIYGSVAKQQDTANSDVDLMIVSDELTYADLFSVLEDVTQQLGREVKLAIYSRKQWAQRLARGDNFINRVLAQPRIWLIGGDDALTEP